jgi:2-polyprenyl-6-methoxyphenol hydroxylase-like FAD-dependent oxidoreductase
MTQPILIAGAGPVGLTLAAELARYKVPFRIVDRAPAPTDKSKAIAMWPRTLELLERMGCAGEFTKTGLQTPGANIFSGREHIARVAFGDLDSRFRYLLLIPQSRTERILSAHLASLGVAVERSTEITGLVTGPHGVACTLRRADGSSERMDASWLVGCDGARSFVRQALGLAFEGDTIDETFVLADVHVDGAGVPTDELAIFWHEEGIAVFFPIAPRRYRIIADAGTNVRHDPTLAEIQALVDRRGPGGVTLSDPIWLSGFVINERKVNTFRSGRAFVAGDAAHIHSPAGGQGMNTGMQDAFNLAWKLALVAHGRAAPALLDSYDLERSDVAKQILADSGRLTRVATMHGSLAQHLRNFVAHRMLGLPFVQHAMADKLAEITIGYPTSPLNAGSAEGLKGPRPGARIVDAKPFGAGNSPRFALMVHETPAVRALMKKYADLVEPALRTPPDPSGIWLVRPDGYVAAVAHASNVPIVEACLARIADGT